MNNDMKELKDKIELIIERSSSKEACKHCQHFNSGTCTFGCMNEGKLKGAFQRITSPEYSCGNFSRVYSFNEDTLDALRDLLADIERINEGKKNLDLLLSGKISEEEFTESMK